MKRLILLSVVMGMLLCYASCMPELPIALLDGSYGYSEEQTSVVVISEETDVDSSDRAEAVTMPGNDALRPDCDHRYGDWEVFIEPKCETEGLKYRLCQRCNGRQEATVEATGHTETAMPTIPPTCTMTGAENGIHCSACRKVFVEPDVIPVEEHNFHESGICISCGFLKNGGDGLGYLELYNQEYGYAYLGTMENGDACQQFYRLLDEKTRHFHTDPSLNAAQESEDYDPVVGKIEYEKLGLTVEEAQAVWKTYRDDNPLYYWLSNMVACNSKYLYLLAYPEYAHGTQRMATNAVLYQKISGYLSAIPSGATDYQIALLMHDRMIASIDYALDESGQPQMASWAHSILGVFEETGAVCEGFARAYQLLLNFKGVDCLLVTGTSREQGHAWNMIRLDGEWFGVDVTWDDGSENSNPYAYFCLSDSQFYSSHEKDLPTETSVDFLYEVPDLCDYSIEWTDLYLDDVLVGRYICIDRAFEAMTDPEGVYTVRLIDGKDDDLLHDTNRFHICGDLPSVGELTLIGRHTVTYEGFLIQRWTATEVCLEQNVTLHCTLTLKSLLLMSEEPVTVTKKGTAYQLLYDSRNYSEIKKTVSVE